MGDTSWDTLKLGMSTCDLLLRVCGLRKSIKEKGHRKVLSSLQATVCIGREKMGVVPVAPSAETESRRGLTASQKFTS